MDDNKTNAFDSYTKNVHDMKRESEEQKKQGIDAFNKNRELAKQQMEEVNNRFLLALKADEAEAESKKARKEFERAKAQKEIDESEKAQREKWNKTILH